MNWFPFAEVEKHLECCTVDNQPMTAKEIEQTIHNYQTWLHKLDIMDWKEVERHSTGVGQLTGLVLCQVIS